MDSVTPDMPQNQFQSSTPGPQRTPRKLLLFIITIATLVIIGAIVFYLASSNNSSSSEDTPPPSTSQQKESEELTAQEEETPPSTAKPQVLTQEDSSQIKRISGEYIEAVRTKNQPAAVALTCEQLDPGLMYAAVTTSSNYSIQAIGGPTSSQENRATIVTKVATGGEEIEFKILFEKDSSGSWCIYL